MFFIDIGVLLLISSVAAVAPAAANGIKLLQINSTRGNVCQLLEKNNQKMCLIYRYCMPYTDECNQMEMQIFQCMSNLPHLIQSKTTTRQEIKRDRSSLSIFLILLNNSTLEFLADFLDGKQISKVQHFYIFMILPLNGQQQLHVNSQQLRRLFCILWTKQIVKVLAFSFNTSQIFSYEPFSPVGWRIIELTSLDINFFEKDKLKNWHQSQIRFSMFADPIRAKPRLPNTHINGYDLQDGEMARLIAKQLNATAGYLQPEVGETYGQIYPNGTVTGALKHIVTGQAHIRLITGFNTFREREYIEQLYPLERRFSIMVVPAATQLPESLIFYRVFRGTVWLLWLMVFFVTVILFHIAQLLHTHVTPNVFNSFKIIYLAQLGKSFNDNYLPKTHSIRLLLIYWIMFSYIFTNIYVAVLTSNFSRPFYERNIDRLDDMWRINIPIYSVKSLAVACKAQLSEKHWNYISNLIRILPANSSNEYLKIASKQPQSAFILRKENAMNLYRLSVDPVTQRPGFHVLKEPLGTFENTYIVPKGSAFLHLFDEIVTRCFETGIVAHEVGKLRYKRGLTVCCSPISIRKIREKTKGMFGNRNVLDLKELQGAFYLWIIGIVSGFICWFAEMYQKNRILLN